MKYFQVHVCLGETLGIKCHNGNNNSKKSILVIKLKLRNLLLMIIIEASYWLVFPIIIS